MYDEREQFGQRLEEILNTKGISRRQTAREIGCTGATIGRWIRGEVPYSVIPILAELHRKYGIDLNELVCGKDK